MRKLLGLFTILAVLTISGCGGGSSSSGGSSPSSANAITSFSFPSSNGIINASINQTSRTITAAMPYGSNVTNLIATFTTTGQSVMVGTTPQVSGTTANNFTNPVHYIVIAANGSKALYTVTVSVSSLGIHGINYDPAHSQIYVNAQESDDVQGMQNVIDQDLQQIKQAGFAVIKTYYSQYCTIDGNPCISITDEAAKYGLKVALGVYEFGVNDGCSSSCRVYTATQVLAAESAVNSNPSTVVAIIVGNEDINELDESSGAPIADDIVTDISAIKANINTVVPVGSAQTYADVNADSTLYQNVVNVSDFIGVNVYPFWDNTTTSGAVGASMIYSNYVQPLQTKYTPKPVVVTEEGWPSDGNGNYATPPIPGLSTSQAEQNAYYTAWNGRQDNFDSYYFSMYDKLPSTTGFDVEGSADIWFGLCNANNTSKSGSTFICP